MSIFARCGNDLTVSEVRVLLIEDDAKTARALASGLRSEGFEPMTVNTGEEGFFLLSRESFDFVILDWMLPGRDGIEVLRTLRARGSKTPVLLLIARDAVDDRVLGLNAGADDYLQLKNDYDQEHEHDSCDTRSLRDSNPQPLP
jgi:DNA-binding response OmpR family regulator